MDVAVFQLALYAVGDISQNNKHYIYQELLDLKLM
jgi:hypothetical protein